MSGIACFLKLRASIVQCACSCVHGAQCFCHHGGLCSSIRPWNSLMALRAQAQATIVVPSAVLVGGQPVQQGVGAPGVDRLPRLCSCGRGVVPAVLPLDLIKFHGACRDVAAHCIVMLGGIAFGYHGMVHCAGADLHSTRQQFAASTVCMFPHADARKTSPNQREYVGLNCLWPGWDEVRVHWFLLSIFESTPAEQRNRLAEKRREVLPTSSQKSLSRVGHERPPTHVQTNLQISVVFIDHASRKSNADGA